MEVTLASRNSFDGAGGAPGREARPRFLRIGAQGLWAEMEIKSEEWTLRGGLAPLYFLKPK